MAQMSEPTPCADRTGLIVRPVSYLHPSDPQLYFSKRQPLEVELGSGDGGFLAAWAARQPHRNFLGIERLLGRLRKLDRKGRRTGLTNLALLRVEAAYFVAYLLPASSVDAFHIYFPDPWPKRKHLKNRLIIAAFAEATHRALNPGGAVYLRTDHSDYFAQMETVYRAHHGFEPGAADVSLRETLTDFERDFLGRGIPTLHACFRKSTRSNVDDRPAVVVVGTPAAAPFNGTTPALDPHLGSRAARQSVENQGNQADDDGA
jgi:tRNA (guanine-N7-)-methyltransferase